MERAEIISQILAILEDVAEVSPEDVNENSVLMDDLGPPRKPWTLVS